jgi:hypothetical protein
MTKTEYVLLEAMSDADIAFNVHLLHREAKRVLKHADALEDYGRRTEIGPDGKRHMKVAS